MSAEKITIPGWIAEKFEASYVSRVKARVEFSDLNVPKNIDGYEISNLGHQLLGWWFGKRGDRTMPVAEDVDIRSLVELSPYTRLASWEGPEQLIIRLFGSALSVGSGHDTTGEDVYADLEAPWRAADICRMRQMNADCFGVINFWLVRSEVGNSYLLEAVHLPIGAGSDGKERIFSTFMPVNKGEAETEGLGDRWESALEGGQDFQFCGEVFVDLGLGVPKDAVRPSNIVCDPKVQ